jgi:lipopolysaccharide transport system ATP-binding protein
MNDIAIKVENLSKKYRIGLKDETPDTLLEKAFNIIKSPFRNYKNLKNLKNFSDFNDDDVLLALNDISFEVKEGEVFGIIGPNGSGKSTLLKLLSRITLPTYGRAEINGRVASLLEVGTGFHPELTGRENVYLNGTILGMTKAEVKSKFDQIVDFSGIGKFIDTPIKRYSSGMSVRLAFSVAAFLEPEILLIDEVLAVGDIQFQKQCLNQVDSISKSGRTVLLVSHNMTAISNICDRAMLINGGCLHSIGNPIEIVNNYNKVVLDNMQKTNPGVFNLENRERLNKYGIDIKAYKLVLCNSNDEPSDLIYMGQKFIAKLYIQKNVEGIIPDLHYALIFRDNMSNRIATINTQMIGKSIDIKSDKAVILFSIEKIPFADIRVSIDINISQQNQKVYDYLPNAASFELSQFDIYGKGYNYYKYFGSTFIDSFDIELGV